MGFSLVLWPIEKFGDPNLALPPGPPFFKYSDPAECERLLESAGFTYHVEVLNLTWKLSGTDELFQAFLHGTARTGGLLRRQRPDDLAKIRAAVVEAAQAYIDHDEVIIPMPAQLAWGERKP